MTLMVSQKTCIAVSCYISAQEIWPHDVVNLNSCTTYLLSALVDKQYVATSEDFTLPVNARYGGLPSHN